MGETLNERLRRAAEMARQRQQTPGIPNEEMPPHNAQQPSHPQQPVQPRSASQPEPPRVDRPQYNEPIPPVTTGYNPAPDVPPVDIYGPAPEAPKKRPNRLLAGAVALGVLLLLALAVLGFVMARGSSEKAALEQEKEQLQLALEQQQLSNEYETLNNEFAQYENQTSLLENDSIVQKYSAAKAQDRKSVV